MLNGGYQKRISKPIVMLATLAISLGVAVMLLSVSVAVGFQTEVRDKVLGFGGHVQLLPFSSNGSFESERMDGNPEWLSAFRQDPDIKSIFKIAYKPAILQSREVNGINEKGEDLRDLSGIIFKGIDSEFDSEFIRENMVEGVFPTYGVFTKNDTILVSKYTANQLQLSLYEKVTTFFVSEGGPKQRNYIVGGVYETGLTDFDKQFAFIDLEQINRLNKWNIDLDLELMDSCFKGAPILIADVKGGSSTGQYKYNWNNTGYDKYAYQPICLDRDTIIKVVATDFSAYEFDGEYAQLSVADSAELVITIQDYSDSCFCTSANQKWVIDYPNDSSKVYSMPGKKITTIVRKSKGVRVNYCGGYEVILKKFENLNEGSQLARNYTGNSVEVSNIVDRHQEIFNWLSMLDLNVYMILGLMTIVAIINMTSALLVMILERTRMIGIIKALGGGNWLVRKIFLLNAGYVVLRGLLFGNLLGFGIITLQNYTGVFTLDQANYYVSVVPMHYVWDSFLWINLGAFIFCVLALVLPSYFVTKITPVKAIRFD
ncbi:MAG: lipoprotein-releasing system permease protein [Flavobacteriales bacterium]|jgi:lipoprotein-releasing system permease protein